MVAKRQEESIFEGKNRSEGLGVGCRVRRRGQLNKLKNKMSIEYQLYSMSITNQIIIPVVGNRQSFHQQNVFVHNSLALTPRKEPNSPQPLLWKKTSSAFKKFKDKKDRKQHLQSPEAQNAENHPPPAPSRLYVLAKKTSPATLSFKQLQDSSKQIAPFGYFDPNEAPLFKALFSQAESSQMKEEYLEILRERRSKSCLKMDDEQVAQCRALKIEPLYQKMQEQGYMQSMQVLRDDDPFIIIRKYGRQKGMKGAKTKSIKKERFNNKQPILTYQRQSLKSIIMANRVSEKSLSGSQLSLKVAQSSPSSKPGFTTPIDIKQAKENKFQHIDPFRQPPNNEVGLAMQIESSGNCHQQSDSCSEEGSWRSSGRAKGIECD